MKRVVGRLGQQESLTAYEETNWNLIVYACSRVDFDGSDPNML